MSLFTCLICNETASEHNDHYRELDCSFPRCPGRVYHEECIQQHLRKKGRGSERKTGYPCPAVLDNGGPCPGTVMRTHIKTPTNLKKKELSRQAAVTVNTLANTEHAKVKQSRGLSKKMESTNQVAKPSAAKIASAAIMAAPNGKRQNMVPDKLDSEDSGAPGSVRTMADFMPGTIQRLSTKANNATTSGVSAPAAAPWTHIGSKTALAPNPNGAHMTSAVSKNTAMNPEPVVRQRVVPGWNDAIKPSKLSTLEEQRAMVAAPRAQVAGGTGRGNKAAVTAAVAAPGNQSAAGGAPSKADAGPGRDGRIRASTNGGGYDQPCTQSGSPNSIFSVGTRGWMDSSASGDFFSLPQEDFPALGVYSTAASFGSAGVEALAPESPMSVVMEPLDTADDYSLSAPTSPPPITSFSDGEVDYHLLFMNAEGKYMVQDANGNYVLMEDVFGSASQVVALSDAYGNLSYCVVVPKAHAVEQAGVAAGYGGSDGMAVGVMGLDALGAEAAKSIGLQVVFGAGAPGYGNVDVAEPLAAAEDVEDEIHVDELMALLYGQA